MVAFSGIPFACIQPNIRLPVTARSRRNGAPEQGADSANGKNGRWKWQSAVKLTASKNQTAISYAVGMAR